PQPVGPEVRRVRDERRKMREQEIEVHPEMDRREQALVPDGLEPWRQGRQSVAGFEGRPEAQLVVPEEERDAREDAEGDADPALDRLRARVPPTSQARLCRRVPP